MLYKNDSNQLNLVNGIVTEINKKEWNMNITQNTLCKSWTKWKTSTLKFVKQASFDLGEKDWRSDRGQQKNWQKTWSDVSEVGKIEKNDWDKANEINQRWFYRYVTSQSNKSKKQQVLLRN